MRTRKDFDYIIGLLLIVVASVIFLGDSMNDIRYQFIGFDEGYNATVAANVMRYGEYRVSYPNDIIFYNTITTGPTMIWPTAILYKIFGINATTSAIVSVVYGILCIFLFWILLKECLKKMSTNTISAVLVIVMLLSDGWYLYLSRHLIGEIAALFFVLLSVYFLYQYFEKKQFHSIFFAGALMACSFLTKSSMIFFVVSFIGMILIEMLITRSIELKKGTGYFIGFLSGFLMLDLYKIFQLGGLEEYFAWWKMEWQNMLNQSSGIDISYSIRDKIDYLDDIFVGCNKYFGLFLIIAPVLMYAYLLFMKFFKKQEITNSGLHAMTMGGVGAASLMVYFILLGGSGLVYARRHQVNAIFLRMFGCYIIAVLLITVIKLIRERKDCTKQMISKMAILAVTLWVLVVSTFPWNLLKTNAVSYIHKENIEPYNVRLMEEFLDEVEELPENATIYCAGWWQEPNVTLYLDRDMKSIYEVTDPFIAFSDECYFIIGNYIDNIKKSDLENVLNIKFIRIDESEVDYNKYSPGTDRKDFDIFAIYKIELND